MNMLFGSSPSSSGRIETMKSAEIALISFTHRFLGIYSFSNSNDNNESKLVALANNSTTSTPDSKTTTFKKYQSETHTLEVFDTKIPRSSVPLRQPKSMFQRENEVTDHFTIHGVKVTSHSYDKTHTTKEAEEPPLVLLHGYMNGSLYFYRNLLGLSNFIGPQVYSLDCLGWGLSSRPKFSLETGSTTTSSKTTNNNDHDHESYTTEQVYVESLEAWRKSHCINKMILGGHSIGGLFACAYAEKYPENVERLILISPAGVPDDKEIDMEARLKDRPLRFKMMFGVAKGLWNLGVNPSSFLRNLPESTGRRWVRNYIEGRLPAITCPEEKKHLGEYLYTNAALPGSGEHSLNKVLKPTSFAKKPGVHRIPQLKVNNVEFIYVS